MHSMSSHLSDDKPERTHREYIRHPSDIPIHIEQRSVDESIGGQLNNVSVGGLAFRSKSRLESGQIIKIVIDMVEPVFEVEGLVQWCHDSGGDFEIGVEFSDSEDAFRVRMVEQVCHIEQYRHEVWRLEKRLLSGDAAAAEWIQKYAHQFPNIDQDTE